MAAGKHDVELAKIERSTKLWGQAIQYGFYLACVVASWLPLNVVRDMVAEIAGKDTNFNFNFAFSVAISISVVGNAVQATLGQQRRQTVKDQRARLDRFEDQVGLWDADKTSE